MKFLKRSKFLNKVEGTVRTFTLSFCNAVLYVILVISIIGILGVPMASVVAVLASAGVAVGLALQGALANLAGGIMLAVVSSTPNVLSSPEPFARISGGSNEAMAENKIKAPAIRITAETQP